MCSTPGPFPRSTSSTREAHDFFDARGLAALTACRKSWIQRHAAVDEDACSRNVVGLIGCKKHGYPADVSGLSNPLIGNECEKRLIGFRSVPGGLIDRRPNCPRTDAIYANPLRSQFLRHALHQHHYA